MKCIACGIEIPEGRLKALPGTKTCVQHSTTERFAVNVVSYGDAEAGELTQEVEVIRDKKAVDKLESYKKQLGSYK
jgi:hypothetical protein